MAPAARPCLYCHDLWLAYNVNTVAIVFTGRVQGGLGDFPRKMLTLNCNINFMGYSCSVMCLFRWSCRGSGGRPEQHISAPLDNLLTVDIGR